MNRFIAIALRHCKPVIGLNIVLSAIALYSASKVTEVWAARAKLILPKSSSDLNANLGTLGDFRDTGVAFSQQVNPLNNLSSIMTSNDTISQIWESDPEKSLYPRLSVYKSLFDVSPEGESTIISLSAEGTTPELARQRTAALIEAFQQRLNELRQDDAVQRSQFMGKELEQAATNLRQAQAALTAFKASSNLVSAEDQTREMVTAINTLTTEQAQVLAQARASKARVEALSTRLELNPEQAIRSLSLGENQDYQFLRQELSEVEALLAQTQAKFTNENPQVQALLEQREELQGQIEGYIAQARAAQPGVNATIGQESAVLIRELILAESQTEAYYSQGKQIQTQIDQLGSTLKTIPAAQARLVQLQQQYDIAEGVYNGLVAQVQQSKLNAFSSYPSVQVFEKPRADSKPSGPGRRPIALGTILASVFGSTAIVLFLESRNPLLSLQDLQATNFPVLRSIPYVKHLVVGVPSRVETEIEFQRLASAVSMKPLKNRCLTIASATSGEGKTTVTLGLASALITLGFRVLVVDGDFRKAELSQRLGCDRYPMSKAPLTPVQIRPGLDLLSLRPDEDKIAEFVARGSFEECLSTAQASGHYDYILIDSAPVSLTSEAALMATVVPNILLVVWPGKSNRNPFRDTLEQLARHRAEIIGLVVNGVDTQAESYLYGHKIAEVGS
ncbi:MAG: P-loop NTPase [Moorea sp. SIO1G6]|uniref:GumC family protein n=1 Tax=Moorena sp. SIO1G6 TaxID=2607840 RepID=UPI0013C2115A|nr:tyrosine-protein kinase domain-containing protein [Moorena sp. SIO1G6]NET62922.1 P-loop NTPase [Moorena sp. SIO1G6]